MNVLVTGGCGYIGLWLCKKLREVGHEVRVVDKGFFPAGVAALEDFAPGCGLMRADIRDLAPSTFAGIDAVCHLGGLSNDPTADFAPTANYAINAEATAHLAAQAKAAGVRRFTFASSASVYGGMHESAITETGAINPVSHYARSKVDGEEALLALADANFEPVILRQATVSGWSPRMRWDLVVNTMVACAMRDGVIRVHAGGEAMRPLIDVQDCAEVHVRFLALGEAGVYNVAKRRKGHGDAAPLIEGYTIACLALYIVKLLQDAGHDVRVEGDWSRGEGRSYDLDCTKMREALGWEPMRGVAEMVADLLPHTDGIGDAQGSNIGWMTALSHGGALTDEFGGVL